MNNSIAQVLMRRLEFSYSRLTRLLWRRDCRGSSATSSTSLRAPPSAHFYLEKFLDTTQSRPSSAMHYLAVCQQDWQEDLHEPDWQMSMQKPKDPMTALPLEIVHLILRQLNYRHHIKLLQVSKTWSEIILYSDLLKGTLTFPTIFDMGHKKNLITPVMMKAGIGRWTRPRYLMIDEIANGAAGDLIDRLRSWQDLSSLERLEVGCCNFLLPTLPLDKYKLKVLVIDHKTKVALKWICDSLLNQCLCLESARFLRIGCTKADNSILKSDSLRELELRSDREGVECVSC